MKYFTIYLKIYMPEMHNLIKNEIFIKIKRLCFSCEILHKQSFSGLFFIFLENIIELYKT